MCSSFDDKVYEVIKNESGLYDELFPVGSVVRRKSKTPPSLGTWQLLGVYGSINAEDSMNYVEHRMILNGKFVIDNMMCSTQNAPVIKFDNYLGTDNYTLIRSFDSFAGDSLTSMVYNCFDNATGDNHNKFMVYTHYSNKDYASLTKYQCDDDCKFQSTLLLQINDLSRVPENDIVFEFERTA